MERPAIFRELNDQTLMLIGETAYLECVLRDSIKDAEKLLADTIEAASKPL